MYAIVEISGKQYKVQNEATISVDKLSAEKDMSITLDKVLLYADGENILIGQPYLTNVKIEAKSLGNIKGIKVRGVKFKRRKNYTRTKGHRQHLSQLKINSISMS
jgi:large subunit ribosomal protein L21